MFAVIPSLVLAGPLALLWAVLPAAFAASAIFWRRWGWLLGVASVNSTLVVAHAWWQPQLAVFWWGGPPALWSFLGLISLIGAFVSWRRSQPTDVLPTSLGIGVTALACVVFAGLLIHALVEGVVARSPWREVVPLLSTLLAGLVTFALARRRGAPARFAEAGMLAGMALGCGLVAILMARSDAAEVVWRFEADEPGAIYSTPFVDERCVYVSVAHSKADANFGAVYCLDQQTGDLIWRFDRAGRMKQALSSPIVAGGRLYVGEGLHEDTACGMYCLDAASGRELWRFPTGSHTESSPRVADGNVYFGAGEDGVYCLDATTGKQRWRFEGLHVDAMPLVAGNRLYAGSVGSDAEMFCLDTATGRPVWRVPSDLTIFSAPAIVDQHVIFGVGNGKLNRAADEPTGAVVCLDAVTGRRVWRFDVPDAVLGTPALVGEVVCFGARHGYCYGLDRRDGRPRWKTRLGSAVIGVPTVFRGRLYVLTIDGTICCIDPTTGLILARFDLNNARRLQATSGLAIAPVDEAAKLFATAALHDPFRAMAVVYCVRMP